MIGDGLRNRRPGHDVIHIECDVGVLEEEFERRVRHEVAWRQEGKKPDAVSRDARGRPPVETLHTERVRLPRHSSVAVADELHDRRKIHQGGGVLRIDHHPFDQPAADRSEVGAAERPAGQRCQPDRNRRFMVAAEASCQGIRGHCFVPMLRSTCGLLCQTRPSSRTMRGSRVKRRLTPIPSPFEASESLATAQILG